MALFIASMSLTPSWSAWVLASVKVDCSNTLNNEQRLHQEDRLAAGAMRSDQIPYPKVEEPER